MAEKVQVTAETFRAAARHLRSIRWICSWGDLETQTCLLGACAHAQIQRDTDEWMEWRDGEASSRIALLLDFSTPTEAMRWNDAPNRRKEEVIDRLEAAACKLEPKEEI